jgi:hypothetical protein
MMEASAAIENEGTDILSDTYNLQDIPYLQSPVRAYSIHKIALQQGIEGLGAVSVIRWRIVNSSRVCRMQYLSLLGLLLSR